MRMIMSSRRAFIAALALAGAGLAHAEGTEIVSISKDAAEVQLYKSPSISEKGDKVPANGLPWKITTKSKGFYQVTTPAGTGWVNAMDVRTAPATTVVCSTPPTAMHVAGSMNAGTPRCK